ncbi:hypothetical protein BJ138DRAFT_1090217 [Hygrophoropsis aurantiaca]|uniref:Uncharacterized protein n=1 Tax=Hygrophoropsis aurantiaca TaxID=72124 RepID=A0ACB8A744_9AGAM|nr:hypothetical protein BJ138DRAFT_1090217 [Hygrophoropsis aurantiaca]
MAAYYSDPLVPPHSSPSLSYNGQSVQNHDNTTVYALPTDSENEIEVDELDSDSEPGDGGGANASTAGQKRNGKKLGERVPGSSLISASRIKDIVETENAFVMSKEATFLLSIATEEFIKRMTQAGQRHASALRRTTVNYADMASSTKQYQEFMFLQDTIPEPISLADALERRDAREKEVLEANPALSSTLHMQPSPFVSSASVSQPNGGPKTKSRPTTNGKEKLLTNHSESASSSSPKRDHKRRDDRRQTSLDNHIDGTASWGTSSRANRSVRGRRSEPQEGPDIEMVNGTSHRHSAEASWTEMVSPPRHASSSQRSGSRSSYEYPEPSSHHSQHDYAPNWPVGPASGFLQDPHGGFGRITQNPGRTIYSQQHRP